MASSLVRAVVVCAAAGAASCGGGNGSSSPGPGGGSGGDTINGSERIGWTQAAGDPTELASFRYVMYVDGSRTPLNDAACTNQISGAGYPCTSRLPALTPGAHSLELASYVDSGGTVVESDRSAAIRVTVAGATAGPDRPSDESPAASFDITAADGTALRASTIVDGLDEVSAIAATRGARVFVAERAGRIRVLDEGVMAVDPALELDDAVMPAAGSGGILSMALDPDFERTRLVYLLYAAAGRGASPVFRLARFREVGARFGERMVLLDEVPAAADPHGAIAFGPDGRLYVALDDAGDPVSARRLSTMNGKIVRLNSDGTIPDDGSAARPVFLEGLQSPRDLDRQPSSLRLWLTSREDGRESVRLIRRTAGRTPPGEVAWAMPLPAEIGASSVAFHSGEGLPPFRGDLFVAASVSGQLLRLRFDDRDAARVVSTESLLERTADGILVVEPASDGALYVGTRRTIIRIAPR